MLSFSDLQFWSSLRSWLSRCREIFEEEEALLPSLSNPRRKQEKTGATLTYAVQATSKPSGRNGCLKLRLSLPGGGGNFAWLSPLTAHSTIRCVHRARPLGMVWQLKHRGEAVERSVCIDSGAASEDLRSHIQTHPARSFKGPKEAHRTTPGQFSVHGHTTCTAAEPLSWRTPQSARPPPSPPTVRSKSGPKSPHTLEKSLCFNPVLCFSENVFLWTKHFLTNKIVSVVCSNITCGDCDTFKEELDRWKFGAFLPHHETNKTPVPGARHRAQRTAGVLRQGTYPSRWLTIPPFYFASSEFLFLSTSVWILTENKGIGCCFWLQPINKDNRTRSFFVYACHACQNNCVWLRFQQKHLGLF